MAILIVGLGNPGKKYTATRHNAGFLAVEHLADSWEADWKENKLAHAKIAEANVDGQKVILAKPQTFMNLSGEAVASLRGKYKVEPKNIWVIYDEAAIEPNQLRVRIGGSAGGHNGLKSIIEHIGPDFTRFRIGIGSPAENTPLEDYVLQKFSKEELLLIRQKLDIIEAIVERSITEGIKEETVTIA